jgi:hypothetical protein
VATVTSEAYQPILVFISRQVWPVVSSKHEVGALVKAGHKVKEGPQGVIKVFHKCPGLQNHTKHSCNIETCSKQPGVQRHAGVLMLGSRKKETLILFTEKAV